MDYHHLKTEFFAGGSAGAVGILIGFPFDSVKVKLQAFPNKYPSAIACLKHSMREEGLFSLYRGCLSPVIMQGFINSLLFIGESSALRILEPNLKNGECTNRINTFIAGSCGGILQCVVLVPSEVIKCTMQAGTGNDILTKSVKKTPKITILNTTPPTHAFAPVTPSSILSGNNFITKTYLTGANIYKTEGIRGLYKGFGVTALREVPAFGLYFFTYRLARDLIQSLEGTKEASSFATLTAGGFAGALSWTIIYPFDVIKTNIQISSDNLKSGSTRMNYQGMSTWQVGWDLYKKHGLRVYTRGLGTTVIRAFPVNAATFYLYETFKKLMHLE